MNPVVGIAEARATLPAIVDKVVSETGEGVVIGSHRKPQAAIISYDRFLRLKESSQTVGLSDLTAKRDLLHRLGSLSGVRDIAVFGSVARGEERADSDIDLLVSTDPGTSLFDLASFESDVRQLFDRKVDVVTRNSLDRVRDRQVLAEAIAL
jgi:predicted nucleotidyltransferase